MAAWSVKRIKHAGKRLMASDVDTIASKLSKLDRQQAVVIDLKSTRDTSTAALAKLVRLRSLLRQNGCHLFIYGLGGRAKAMYEIYRMVKLLPCIAPHVRRYDPGMRRELAYRDRSFPTKSPVRGVSPL